ncbi:hypothetical protein E1267_33980 [Nonomuraea longispora]|uniref:Uncharacterized protein n=2 Tax=Nonomuraea longispora TaxID=1848320 RepID=A0A4V6P9N7_9ACTN|nr:hypothetical protein E1267_33980 [Nonomuraea longispora]
MARFAAGARRLVLRATAVGSLVAAGWLLAVLFGMLTAAPAAAESTAVTGASHSTSAAGVPASETATDLYESATATDLYKSATAMGTPVAEMPAVPSAVSEVGASAASLGPGHVSASDNAEAMAGRTVDGLNSQQDPGLPTPSTAGKILDTNGLVPNGGGSGPFGSATGDVARSVFDPRLEARRSPPAYVLPPVVRTAADDPSFSPD